jgi:excisionase family DNA binding protein
MTLPHARVAMTQRPPTQTLDLGLPPLATVDEVAGVLRVSTRQIKRWIATGRLRAARVVPGPGTSRVLIPRAQIERLINEAMQ